LRARPFQTKTPSSSTEMSALSAEALRAREVLDGFVGNVAVENEKILADGTVVFETLVASRLPITTTMEFMETSGILTNFVIPAHDDFAMTITLTRVNESVGELRPFTNQERNRAMSCIHKYDGGALISKWANLSSALTVFPSSFSKPVWIHTLAALFEDAGLRASFECNTQVDVPVLFIVHPPAHTSQVRRARFWRSARRKTWWAWALLFVLLLALIVNLSPFVRIKSIPIGQATPTRSPLREQRHKHYRVKRSPQQEQQGTGQEHDEDDRDTDKEPNKTASSA